MICPHCKVRHEPVIPLTNGGAMRVDQDDYYAIVRYVWYRVRRGGVYYAESNVNGDVVLAHRFIAKPEPGLVVDHINGDGLDNRRSNIRVCTQGQNVRNSAPRGGSSKFKGVSYRSGKWRARITVNKRNQSLGRFATEEDAARAYDAAAIKYFGEFARPNFGPPPSEWPVSSDASTGSSASRAIHAWFSQAFAWRKATRQEDCLQTAESELRSYWMSQFSRPSRRPIVVTPEAPKALATLGQAVPHERTPQLPSTSLSRGDS